MIKLSVKQYLSSSDILSLSPEVVQSNTGMFSSRIDTIRRALNDTTIVAVYLSSHREGQHTTSPRETTLGEQIDLCVSYLSNHLDRLAHRRRESNEPFSFQPQ